MTTRDDRNGDGTAAPLVPDRPSVPSLRAAAVGCRACPLWQRGTQTVFGDGPTLVEVMLVGEQPGNEEDLTGHPFVGPAGRLLDRALGAAGIDRRAVYVTNAVKHFKWEARGKRRIHQKPSAGEVRACLAPLVMATVHPSSILRAPDDAARRTELARLVEDLAGLGAALREPPPVHP
jgi:DNA polymerase